jgi:hypothetical protein
VLVTPLLGLKVAMDTAFTAANKFRKLANALFAASVNFTDNRSAS